MSELTISNLNNGKIDLDYIAEIAMSDGLTATDRMGKVKPTVRGAITTLAAFNPRGEFAPGTIYEIKDVYTFLGISYVAIVGHLSTTVLVDVAQGRVVVHQGATKEELAQQAGSSMIGNLGEGAVPETLSESLGNMQHVRRADISSLLTRDGVVVFGGDSLGFDAYPFGDGLNPGGNAYDNPPGLMSPAHMVRDACYASDPFFMSVEKLVVKGANGIFNSATEYTLPFNNRFKQFLAANQQQVQITLRDRVPTNTFGNAVLLFAKSPADNRCGNIDIFVDGAFNQTINLDGRGGLFRGYEMVRAIVPSGVVTLRNFTNPDGSPAQTPVGAFLLGVTHQNPTFHLTAHGGWTAKNILDDFGMRIGRYAPDVLFLIIGANDIHTNRTPEQFYADLVGIVTQTRALKAKCEIILISSPPCSTNGAETKTAVIPWAGRPVYAWLKMMEQVAREFGCFYLDLYAVFGNIPREVWRFDNIHWNKIGCNIAYRALKELVFPSMPEPKDVVLDALFSNGNTGMPFTLPNFEGVLCHHDGDKWIIDSDIGGLVEQIYQPGAAEYEVQIAYSSSHYLISFEHFGSSNNCFIARPYIASYANSHGGLDGFYLSDAAQSPLALATKAALAGAQFFMKFALRSR